MGGELTIGTQIDRPSFTARKQLSLSDDDDDMVQNTDPPATYLLNSKSLTLGLEEAEENSHLMQGSLEDAKRSKLTRNQLNRPTSCS